MVGMMPPCATQAGRGIHGLGVGNRQYGAPRPRAVLVGPHPGSPVGGNGVGVPRLAVAFLVTNVVGIVRTPTSFAIVTQRNAFGLGRRRPPRTEQLGRWEERGGERANGAGRRPRRPRRRQAPLEASGWARACRHDTLKVTHLKGGPAAAKDGLVVSFNAVTQPPRWIASLSAEPAAVTAMTSAEHLHARDAQRLSLGVLTSHGIVQAEVGVVVNAVLAVAPRDDTRSLSFLRAALDRARC